MTKRWKAAALILALTLTGTAAHAVGPRHINDSDRVELHGNIHPHAQSQNDMGRTDGSLRMDKMVMALKVPAEKKAALEQLLADQQNPSSPDYHRWLTPEEFGNRFAPSSDDVAAVTQWLTSHGFTVEEVAKGKMSITFSGTADTVSRVLGAEIHDYNVDGKVHHANANNPTIPRGLADLVAGPVSLHDFPRQAMNSGARAVAAADMNPLYTSGGSHYLSPADFATIYNLKPLYASGIDGTGQTIAIVGRTHPSSTNWSTFRSQMGLSANAPQVIINGTDPGDIGAGEDNEADLDVEWSGAVARNATIKFVVSKSTSSTDGVDLSAQFIVNNNLAPVMSTSFGSCESRMGSAENTFYNNLWSQAAAQGITSFVSSGDSGAAGCSAASATTGSGAAVNGLSSTPYNVCVGGTQFSEGSGTYWNSSNGSGYSSAIGYIPEVTWNESGSVSGGSGLWSTGGGASIVYAKPSWQVAPGVPADGKRSVPDVSLTAAGHDAYLVQTQGALHAISGTSASSPAFAGIMALVVQKTGQRQGNANGRFYQLASAQYGSRGAAVFHDVTAGSNTVPGVIGFNSGSGYDMATGLGSVDSYALVNNWTGTVAPDFSVSVSPSSISEVQGASASTTVSTNVVGGFSSTVSLAVSGLPAGVTATLAPASLAAPGAGTSTLTLASSTTTSPGTYAVTVTATAGGISHTSTCTLTVTSAAAGPVTLFSDGFEGTGWSTTQVVGTNGKWSLASTGYYPKAYPHGGVRLADFNSYTSASGNQTRMRRSAAFAVPSTSTTVTLKFWMYHDTGYSSYNDRVQAQVSIDGSTWSNVGAALSRYNGTTGWGQVTVDLSAWRGKSIYLGFLGISGYGNDIYLDDVTVTAQ